MERCEWCNDKAVFILSAEHGGLSLCRYHARSITEDHNDPGHSCIVLMTTLDDSRIALAVCTKIEVL